MSPRSFLLALVFAAGVVAGGLGAAAAAPPRLAVQVLLSVVTEELRGPRTRVRVHLDAWEPGAETGRHEHAGPALLYVLEGELEEVQAGGVRPLRAGQVVWNPGRTPHNVRNASERPARVLAVHLEPAR